jgi:PTH2 family peptidyl-tRNA hydrolase
MEQVKQVIIIRRDLKMRRGKEIAQGAHASMKVIFDRLEYKKDIDNGNTAVYQLNVSQAISSWIDGIFTKVVVYVNSLEELEELAAAAEKAGIPHAVITDVGNTEFHGVPTKTALAIGPDDADIIDEITSHLPLY